MINKKITGMMIYYYHVCKRKLWYSCNHINMENENEAVNIGKFLDENTYSSQRKHLLINDEINIDFIKKSRVIHEIKKSRKIEEASIWQVKYYLYYLQKNGVNDVEAKIDYPLLKKSIEVELKQEDIDVIEADISDIMNILRSLIIPDIEEKSICKNCAFYDLCMI